MEREKNDLADLIAPVSRRHLQEKYARRKNMQQR